MQVTIRRSESWSAYDEEYKLWERDIVQVQLSTL